MREARLSIATRVASSRGKTEQSRHHVALDKPTVATLRAPQAPGG
jgi:hypothetical protein